MPSYGLVHFMGLCAYQAPRRVSDDTVDRRLFGPLRVSMVVFNRSALRWAFGSFSGGCNSVGDGATRGASAGCATAIAAASACLRWMLLATLELSFFKTSISFFSLSPSFSACNLNLLMATITSSNDSGRISMSSSSSGPSPMVAKVFCSDARPRWQYCCDE